MLSPTITDLIAGDIKGFAMRELDIIITNDQANTIARFVTHNYFVFTFADSEGQDTVMKVYQAYNKKHNKSLYN